MALIAHQFGTREPVYLPDWIRGRYQYRSVSGVSGSQQPKRSAAEVPVRTRHEPVTTNPTLMLEMHKRYLHSSPVDAKGARSTPGTTA